MPSRIEVLLAAHAKGFHVSPEGHLHTPDGKPRRLHTYRNYPAFNMRHGGTSFHIHMHRLAALCKFGDVIFEENIIIRHKDNDKENYNWDNLLLGTAAHNWDDNPDHIKEKCLSNLRNTENRLT